MKSLRLLAPALLAVALLLPGSARAQGTGLTGQYYDTATFGTLRTTRVDAAVNFNFGTAIPAGTTLTNADTFSVAWSGQIEPEFSQLYTFYVTADDGARLWVNDVAVVMRTFGATNGEMRGQARLTAGQRVNIRLEYIEQTGSASVKLEWSCASRAREVIPTSRLYPARVDKAGGSLLKEHWSGLSGTTIAALTSSANYPARPSGRESITSFEGLAQDWADSYGTRVAGFIVPPATGSYTFAVSGDEVVELYLSPDTTSAAKVLIASVASPTAFRAWGTPSTPVTLTQGQRYYVELLHKEGTGADHWSVGWKKPGDSAFGVVPGSALVPAGLTTAQPTEANLLNTLAQEHPRLFATAERFARLRATWQSATPSQAKTWAQNAINSADTILTQPAVTYAPDVRGTILTESRTVVDRMYKLGLAWQLTGNAQYAERAWTELSTVASNTLFPDWHPGHFLDTAEMTHACAIGYDWLYAYWTQPRRDTIRTAIINKGLNPGLSQFTSNVGWSRPTGNNWNQVCTGGLSMGALAIGTESEALVENILNRALNSTRPCWKHFTTDNGAWYEGPGYWGYTTEYGIRMLAALESALGSDFGISSTQNLSECGFAPIGSLGTSNVIFNYADAGAGAGPRGPVFQWLARRYQQPLYDAWENASSGTALSALWWNASTATLPTSGVVPDFAYHGEAGTAFQPQEMVTLRGKWGDSRATFVGCKGGEMGADHGNLDAGTFVLDALGRRWFHDLGGDNYALPNYFNDTPSTGVDRWDYYRLRPEGQNTLTINPSANADMVLGAVAPLLAFQSEPAGTGSFAIHDLTPVYSGMTRVWRGTRLMGARDEVLIQDEIQAAAGRTVWWFAHYTSPTTAVTIDVDGTSALLQIGTERLWCKIVSGGGTFQIMDAVPLPTSPNPATSPAQNANTGYKKLAINLTNVTNTTLAVWFVPLSAGEAIPTTLPTITPLSTWNVAAVSDPPTATNGVGTLDAGNAVDIDLRSYVSDDSTPAEQMRFAVSGAVNGTVVLLADGHTARFTPTPGYVGAPQFTFTVTDATTHPQALLTYDFELPDSSTANVVPDASGRGRDGTLDAIGTGAATLQADGPAALGRAGRSLDLAENGGANAARLSRIVTTAEMDWDTSAWTVTGWFKRRDATNEDMIWHLNPGDGFGSGEELYLMARGASTLTLHHYPGPDVQIETTAAPPGVWHHFAVVRSGTTMSLYLNGALVGSDSAFTLNTDQNSPLIFGGHTDTTATFAPRWFDGALDELAVFSAALAPAEIATLASGMTVRHFGGLSASATVTLSETPVTYNWTSTASGDWATAANWQAGVAPANSRGTTVQFFTGHTLTAGTTVANNNIATPLQLNALTLGGTTSAAVNVNVTGAPLRLLNNGNVLPTVSLAGSGSTLTYTVANALTLGADATFKGTNSGRFLFTGDITGPGALTRTDSSSTLILAGTNSYEGATTIAAGTLQIGNDGPTGTLGGGDVTVQGTLRFDRTGTLLVPNNIDGSGAVQIDCPINSGTVVLSGVNSFTGQVNVNSGALRITNSAALGAGSKLIRLTNGTSGNVNLRLDGSDAAIELAPELLFQTSNAAGAIFNEAGDNIIHGDITLTGGGGDTRIVASAGSLTLNGDVAPNATGRTLLLAGTGTGFLNGTISNGSNAYFANVTKQDAGTWTLGSANTTSGAVTVAAGTLRIGNPNALGNGGVTVGSGNGATSITAGATLDLNGQAGVIESITARGTGVGGAGAVVNTSANAASVVAGAVSSISTTAGGVHSVVPDVTLTGGGGSGATAVATLGVSAASFSIAGGTTIYAAAAPPTVTITGGGGTGAAATAVLTGGVVSGITITYPGTGYTSAPTIAFTGGTVTTAGTNPTGTGHATNFVVSGVTVTNPGSGYTAAPAVGFSSGTGTAATANLSAFILGAATSLGGSGDLVIQPGITGGSNTLTKVGTGTLTLAGANTYTGTTTISAGRLALAGSVTSALSTGAATLAPQGLASTTASLTQASTATYQVRINGALAGVGYDQLTVGGTVALNGTLDIVAGPNLPPGSIFTIVNKTSAGAVTGTFAGRPNNTTFGAGGYAWTISYTGGDGNDVTLRLANAVEQWRFNFFGTIANTGTAADTFDGNFDGESNLLEFATGQEPSAPSVAKPGVAKSGNTLEFTYTRSLAALASGVVFTVSWSDTLANDWSTAGVGAPTIVSDDGTLQVVKVTVPAGAGSKRFVRMTVARP